VKRLIDALMRNAARVLAVFALVLLADQCEARSAYQVRKFRHDHACPATGKTTGTCPGYVVDHVIPLCAGGPDKPANMQWQTKAESYKKDGQERAYCACIKAHGTSCIAPTNRS
jgi:hypothetical protein